MKPLDNPIFFIITDIYDFISSFFPVTRLINREKKSFTGYPKYHRISTTIKNQWITVIIPKLGYSPFLIFSTLINTGLNR